MNSCARSARRRAQTGSSGITCSDGEPLMPACTPSLRAHLFLGVARRRRGRRGRRRRRRRRTREVGQHQPARQGTRRRTEQRSTVADAVEVLRRTGVLRRRDDALPRSEVRRQNPIGGASGLVVHEVPSSNGIPARLPAQIAERCRISHSSRAQRCKSSANAMPSFYIHDVHHSFKVSITSVPSVVARAQDSTPGSPLKATARAAVKRVGPPRLNRESTGSSMALRRSQKRSG